MHNRNKSKSSERSAGFTLIETCIAMVIMFVAVLGAVSVFVIAIKNNSGANDRELSMAVGQQKLEQLRMVSFSDSSLNETSSSGVTTTITRAGRQYTVNTKIIDDHKVNGKATLKTITVQVAPAASAMGSVVLTTTRTTVLVGPNRF